MWSLILLGFVGLSVNQQPPIVFDAVYTCPARDGYQFKVVSCDDKGMCQTVIINASSPGGGASVNEPRGTVLSTIRDGKCTAAGAPPAALGGTAPVAAGGAAPAVAPPSPMPPAPGAGRASAPPPAPAPPPHTPSTVAVAAVTIGSYECWAFNQARMMLNFKVVDASTYVDSAGTKGTFTFDPTTKRLSFKGGLLEEAMPKGFTTMYYAPKGRPTLSFRGPGGSEAAFCELVTKK